MFHFPWVSEHRFIVNPQDEHRLRVASDFVLEEEEEILLLIDDSRFKALSHYVVLTNRRILAKTQAGISRFKAEREGIPTHNTEIRTNSLRTATVFVDSIGSEQVVTLLDETSAVHVRFSVVSNCDTLRIVFLDYLSRYSGGYAPTTKANVARYKRVLSSLKKDKPQFLSHAINLLAILALGALVAASFMPTAPELSQKILLLLPILLFIRVVQFAFAGSRSRFSNLLATSLFAALYLLNLREPFMQAAVLYMVFFAYSLMASLVDFDRLLSTSLTAGVILFSLFLGVSCIQLFIGV